MKDIEECKFDLDAANAIADVVGQRGNHKNSSPSKKNNNRAGDDAAAQT